ncbi:MAG: sensor histidine kinase [Chloroflexota bacterium]
MADPGVSEARASGGPGLRLRIAATSLAVAAVALGVVAVGILRVASDVFADLMVKAGDTAEHAHAMFDESVNLVFVLAAAIAAVVAVGLATLLARRLAQPLERLADGARRIAGGDLENRVTEDGPPEMRSLAAAYNTMAAQLAEQETVRREFVVNASHELRTPLTNLQGYLEALRDGVIPPNPETFESLGEEIDRLRRLAASLDVLGGPEVERPITAELDLAALVRGAVELVAPSAARRSIELEVAPDPPTAVRGRSDDLTQVLANLLQNAVRYTPSGGRVRVSVDGSAGRATVRVANTGPEIPDADLSRVWERFYRVERSRDRTSGGAGIGLAIVKQLVEDADGRVGASSTGGWTTFWFDLPMARR